MRAEFKQSAVYIIYSSDVYHYMQGFEDTSNMEHGVCPLVLRIYLGRMAIDIKVINNVKFQFLCSKYMI